MDKLKLHSAWYKIWERKKTLKPKVIWGVFGRWYDRKFNFKGLLVLDFGSSKESNFYTKFRKENNSNVKNYKGYDIDETSVQWLKDNSFYYDFYNDDSLKGKFELINASQVYEHLTLIERENFIKRAYELLKKNGILLIDIPYINNLNLIEFIRRDRTHKIVSCEDEAIYIEQFGFDVEVYIGGYTMPYKSLLSNIYRIFTNLILGYKPFYVTVIIGKKR